jgi:hypothetical protein
LTEVDIVQGAAQGINHNVQRKVNIATSAEDVQPSENQSSNIVKIGNNEVHSCDNDNSELYEESLVTELPLTTQAHPVNNTTQPEYKNIQSTPEAFGTNQQETAQQPNSQRIELSQLGNIQTLTGAVLGAAAFMFLGIIFGFSPQQNSLEVNSAPSGTTEIPLSRPSLTPTLETSADGWIFIGNIKNTSTPVFSGKPLVTVRVEPRVLTLRLLGA